MNSKPLQRPNLKSERANRVLMHVCRNTISTLRVLHRQFFDGLSIDACRKAVKTMCDRGYLSKYPLWDNKSLYRIGPRTISAFGFPRKRADKLGAIRLPYEVGCLAYTCMNTEPRPRLFPHELRKVCNEFPEQLMHCWAYTWHAKQLSTVRVEPSCGNPRRIIQKLSEQFYRYCEHEPLEELYRDDRFGFVVVVSSETQETVLHQANEDLGHPIPLETSHYTELVRFM